MDLTDKNNIEFVKEKIIERMEGPFNKTEKIGLYIPPDELANNIVESIFTHAMRGCNPERQKRKGFDKIKRLRKTENALNESTGKFKGAENYLISRALKDKSKCIKDAANSMLNSHPFSILRDYKEEKKEKAESEKN